MKDNNRINHNHQKLINRANKSVEEAKEKAQKDSYRQKYHFMAPAYWLNDPNGLIQFNGEYHLFYQHNPYAPTWGAMYWGHAKSKDLVHWEHLPVALAPSEEYECYEKGGCFSGSAVDDNGTLTLIYTGVSFKDNRSRQVQCIASSKDGITFEKYPDNPVISEPPEDGSEEFRDPKVWKYGGNWYMVVGSCKNNNGKVLLYRSPDLYKWSYIGVLVESDGYQGYMWECPDFFPLGDKYVLIISPMGMKDHKVVYMIGDMNYETCKFTPEKYAEADFGFDFYAPQTFLDDEGRRIMIGWMNTWDWMPWFKSYGPTPENNWCGAMSIPRVLSLLEDGHIGFKPVEELKSLRGQHYRYKNVEVTPGSCGILKDIEGDCLEIAGEFDLGLCNAEEFGFKLRCSADNNEEILVIYKTTAKELSVVRNKSEAYSEEECKCKLELKDNSLKVHIFLDSSSIEVFADEGRAVLSNIIYPHPLNKGIEMFSSKGMAKLVLLDVWELM